MSFMRFIDNLADLVAFSDAESRDWLSDPPLRTAWRTFFLSMCLVAFINGGVTLTPLAELFNQQPSWVQAFRAVMAACMAVLIGLLVILTAAYFRFSLSGGRGVRLSNVVTFYVTEVCFFGMLYWFIYLMEPTWFQTDSNVKWIAEIGERGTSSWSTKASFLLYSLFKSTGTSFRAVDGVGLVPALVGYAQTLYSFALVSLLVAGYINQKTQRGA
jgi:hypothetical protein